MKMRAEYDFSKAAKNPYARKLKATKQQVTIEKKGTGLRLAKVISQSARHRKSD